MKAEVLDFVLRNWIELLLNLCSSLSRMHPQIFCQSISTTKKLSTFVLQIIHVSVGTQSAQYICCKGTKKKILTWTIQTIAFKSHTASTLKWSHCICTVSVAIAHCPWAAFIHILAEISTSKKPIFAFALETPFGVGTRRIAVTDRNICTFIHVMAIGSISAKSDIAYAHIAAVCVGATRIVMTTVDVFSTLIHVEAVCSVVAETAQTAAEETADGVGACVIHPTVEIALQALVDVLAYSVWSEAGITRTSKASHRIVTGGVFRTVVSVCLALIDVGALKAVTSMAGITWAGIRT